MVRLRSAGPGDSHAIATILSDWIDETPWMPRVHTRQEDQGFGALLIEKTDVTVAEAGQRVLGFLARRAQMIDALYLVAAARRQGVGRLLLDAAKASVPRLELWTFQANTGAQAFYTANGFSELERTDGAGNDEKLPDLRMVWEKGDENG